MRVRKIANIVAGSILAGLGCHQAFAADAVPAYIKASIETSARPRTEHKADAAMKPADALMFSGVKPGMTGRCGLRSLPGRSAPPSSAAGGRPPR